MVNKQELEKQKLKLQNDILKISNDIKTIDDKLRLTDNYPQSGEWWIITKDNKVRKVQYNTQHHEDYFLGGNLFSSEQEGKRELERRFAVCQLNILYKKAYNNVNGITTRYSGYWNRNIKKWEIRMVNLCFRNNISRYLFVDSVSATHFYENNSNLLKIAFGVNYEET